MSGIPRPWAEFQLYTAAIAAKSLATGAYELRAGSVAAVSLGEAEDIALEYAGKVYGPDLYTDHQANVQTIPQRVMSKVGIPEGGRRWTLYTAAIGARHNITLRFQLKAGSLVALTEEQALRMAEQACWNRYKPTECMRQQWAIETVPRRIPEQAGYAIAGWTMVD